jgi:glycogen synthase
MKVLLLSPSYHPVLGGLQTVTHEVARALLASGRQVRVITNRYPRRLPETEVVDGVPVSRWPFLGSCGEALRSGRVDLALASLCCNPATAARLKRLLASFQPDVVNLHFPEPRMASLMQVRRGFPFRLVVSLHGDDVERWFPAIPPRAGRELVRELLRSADAVTACSQYLLNRAIDLEPSISAKTTVIHNGVDGSRFLEREEHLHPRPYIFAYGRHTHKKGFDLLLKSFAGLAAQFPEVDLVIAGAGEETSRLGNLRAGLGLQDRVIFYGRAEPDEVVRLLNGCRLVVIPSREEPFGIVAVEALLSGRPVVATRVGGLPEVAAAVAASCAGGSPVIHWAMPDAPDLQRAMQNALTAPPAALARSSGFEGLSLADMARSYQQVLEGQTFPGADSLRRRAIA